MQIVISNKIIVYDAPKSLIQYCRENLILRNPDFYKRQAMGKWTGGTPEHIWLYEQFGRDIHMPFGCLSDVWSMFPDQRLYKIEIGRLQPRRYTSNINLYEYQQKAVNEAIKARNGVIVMPCGAGKTVTGMEIISRIGGRVLWLTHTQDLLNQSMNCAKSVLTTAESYGRITAGKVDIGSGITFATVQTLSKIDLTTVKDAWDVVIVDECQHCCGSPTRVTQFYKVVSNLSARYKFGLTATPKRADGLESAMFAILGKKIFEVTRKDVEHTTCPVEVRCVETGYTPDYDAVLCGDGTLNYAAIVDDMIHDKERFRKVLELVDSLDGSCIVLANRVQYLADLKKASSRNGLCLSAMGTSMMAKRIRKAALSDLNDGRIDVIFATYQLAKEGLDVPNLRYIVFATPEKDETTVIQSVGRVGRKADGKDKGVVYDLIDDFGMYRGWAKKRKGYYKKIGAEVML